MTCFARTKFVPFARSRRRLNLFSSTRTLSLSVQDKTATAKTTIGYCEGPDFPVQIFEGRTEGKIVPARGPKTFGWDPIFEPLEGSGKTYAEMKNEDKNKISHRSRALTALCEWLCSEENRF